MCPVTSIGLTPRVRLDSLTGLRTCAAFIVFAHHATAYGGADPLWSRLTHAGVNGVSFFFILSGFVLAWSAKPGDTMRAFLRRRAARILPLYWVAWVAGAALTIVAGGLAVVPHLLPSLVLLQAWFPDRHVYFAGNSVGWSLSCEMFFYIAFPFLIPLLHRLSNSGLWWTLASSAAFALAFPLLLRPTDPEGVAYWAVALFPMTRALEFVLGICLAVLTRRGVRCPVPFWLALTVAAMVLFASNWAPLYLFQSAATLLPYALLIWSAAMADIDGTRTFASQRWAVRLGEWSYAFYLTHVIVLIVLIQVSKRTIEAPWWAIAIVGFAVALAASAVLCEYVEKPLEKRFRVDHRLPAVTSV